MKGRMKINWGLLGLFIGGVGMLCDHMKDQEEEAERNKSIEELKGRLTALENKSIEELKGRLTALENKYKEAQNGK